MALASQMIQAANRHRHMTSSRRRRGRNPLIVIVALLALLAVGSWWLMQRPRDGDDGRTPTDPQSPIAAEGDSPGAAPSRPVVAEEFPETQEKNDDRMPVLDEPVVAERSEATPDDAAAASAASGTTVPADSTPAETPPTIPTPSVAPPTSAADTALVQALAIVSTDPVVARRELTRLLDGSSLSASERLRAYDGVNEVNQPLFFRSGIVQGDSVFVSHQVESGQTPIAIVRAIGADCEGDLILRVNEISDARRIAVGRRLKVPKGTFHAEVRKGEYRLNLFHGEGPDRVMIASYPVGLGESNTTPTGIFKVRPRSKLKNPQWTNPRTNEFFAADDPKNPIGERWIGLDGIEPHNRDFAGYGIHGTIEPDSIGRMQSMGCIRMRAPDVEVIYEVLTTPNSTVLIAP